MERISRRTALAAVSALALVACGGSDDSPASPPKTDSDPAAIGHVIGSADAPVTLVEYASPTCWHCKLFHDSILPEIQEKYISTGKVRFIYREYPVHEIDVPVYAMALCTGDSNFFNVLDDVFEHQSGITDAARNGVLKAALLAIGERHGIKGEAAFDACMSDEAIRSRLKVTFDQAQKDGIKGTPTFILNGEVSQFEGDIRTAEGFSTKLDTLLANAAGQ
ncbi:DsbA family protein [Hyphomonas oceanitis]|uniref:DsbA family protein n=1 Tax=Hyphomonas oceanitis TaxID=81033 RepID=UPI00300383C2